MDTKFKIINAIIEHKIIAIVRGVKVNEAVKIAHALYSGGIKLIEVTFNSEGAMEMIMAIKEEMKEKMHVGAGTVLDSETAKMAFYAGAEYILSPILDQGMINICNRYGKIAIPGIATPTEAIKAMQWGADFIKLFPASDLGPNYIKSIKGPIKQARIIAVGGINLNNAKEFLNAGAVGLGLGSSLVNNQLIIGSNYEEICTRAKKYISICFS